MDTFGKRLKWARKEKSLSQSDLAHDSGVSQGLISKIERGDQDVTGSVTRLAKACGVDAHWLATGEGAAKPDNFTIGPNPLSELPVISWVQAGQLKEIIDLYEKGLGEDRVATTRKVSNNAFGLRVKGDSMTNPNGRPSFPDGVIVIVEPNASPDNGRTVVARFESTQEATVKKLVIDGPNKYLMPLNPKYDPIPITGDTHIIGVVIQAVDDAC